MVHKRKKDCRNDKKTLALAAALLYNSHVAHLEVCNSGRLKWEVAEQIAFGEILADCKSRYRDGVPGGTVCCENKVMTHTAMCMWGVSVRRRKDGKPKNQNQT